MHGIFFQQYAYTQMAEIRGDGMAVWRVWDEVCPQKTYRFPRIVIQPVTAAGKSICRPNKESWMLLV
jgi:hypothetical protein